MIRNLNFKDPVKVIAGRLLKWPLVLLLVFISAYYVQASHGRYGSISYTNLGPVSPDSCQIEVTVSQAWEMCATICHFPVPPSVGDVSPVTSQLNLDNADGSAVLDRDIILTVTSVNLAEGWYFGEYTTTLTVHCDSSYLLYYEDCCRIFTLVNNSGGAYRNETTVTPPAKGNDSPVGTIPPIVKLPAGSAAASFPIGAGDPDGDPLFFRLALPSEASDGLGINAPGFTVTPGGTGMLSTLPYSVGDLLNAWVAVEDTAGSKIILDFLIEVVDSSAPPVFDYTVTPLPAPCLIAQEGDNVNFKVKASDPDSGDVVSISAVGVPIGANILPSNPSPGGNPDSVTFDWNTGPGDAGLYIVTFTAEDTSGVSTSTSVCVQITAVPEVDTCLPVDVVCESDSSWRQSTYTETAPWGGTWSGANSLPSAATYTNMVTIGQPYGYHSIDKADGADVISAPNNVTFYRKELVIANPSDVQMRIRMSMDDGAEIYLNGHLLLREENSAKMNWKAPVHDILYESDGSIDNGHMGGQMFDLVTAVDLDTVLVAGANELVVALYNLRGASNKGGFSLKLEALVDCPATDSCVSDSTWDLSTEVTQAPWGGTWSGVMGNLPADNTYTLKAMEGQPYPWGGMPAVPGSEPIKADNNVRFYRKCFNVTNKDDVDARIRMYMDDGAEIYLNGTLLVREENMDKDNWTGVYHDIKYNSDGSMDNGHMGGQMFDYVNNVDLDTVLQNGENHLVVALYNLRSSANKGGFSFRLDMTKGGAPVIIPCPAVVPKSVVLKDGTSNGGISVYPNPASSVVQVEIDAPAQFERILSLHDISGRVLQHEVLPGSESLLRIKLENYPAGIYILRVAAGAEVYTEKIMKE